jgi:hypothetical protein
MNGNQSVDKPKSTVPLFEENKLDSLKAVKIGAIICSLAVAATLATAYVFLRTHQLEQVRATKKADPSAKALSPPEAQIYEDEARLKGSEAIIAGTIHNISGESLAELTVEMELKRRASEVTERRKIKIEPSVLGPGEVGRYSMPLPSSEWSGARVLSLNSARRNETIAFRTAVGALRPPERLRDVTQKAIAVPRPRPKGEEFINSPDNPTIVR